MSSPGALTPAAAAEPPTPGIPYTDFSQSLTPPPLDINHLWVKISAVLDGTTAGGHVMEARWRKVWWIWS
jgi:hypothetical protein